MLVGIPKETRSGECRVAATPSTVSKLRDLGFEVLVAAGSGEAAHYPDAEYVAAGAEIAEPSSVWERAAIIAKVRPPRLLDDGTHEADLLAEGALLISLLYPDDHEGLVDRISARSATAIALEKIPRISRAQKMDVLSAMANIAGYRAVLEAASTYGGFFGGQMTAAGRTPPARVLIIGVGVAGLAAIAAARGLGAEVRAFDVRPSTRDQVESLGASFLEVELEDEESGEDSSGYANVMSDEFIAAEMALFAEQAAEVDVIITTALIPGRKAPVLITEEMVQSMKQGSVVVDMAAERGGNCACTVPDAVTVAHGTTIIGYTDLTSRLPKHASQFFSTNVVNLLEEMGGAESFSVDVGNEVIARSLVVLDGGPPPTPPEAAPPAPKPAPQEAAKPEEAAAQPSSSLAALRVVGGLMAVGALAALGAFAPAEFIRHLTVFVLACFVGYQVVWNVTAALHTPLMSVTNAISGIIVVGGMLHAMAAASWASTLLGVVAVFIASINVFGGFLVTQRMLRMFHREGGSESSR